MIGDVEVEENKGRRLRQLRESRQDLANVDWNQGAVEEEAHEEEWMEAWDDVKDR